MDFSVTLAIIVSANDEICTAADDTVDVCCIVVVITMPLGYGSLILDRSLCPVCRDAKAWFGRCSVDDMAGAACSGGTAAATRKMTGQRTPYSWKKHQFIWLEPAGQQVK